MAEPTTEVSLTAFAAARQLELVRFAYLLCRDRQIAEDLVQDVLTAMYRRFGEQLPDHHPMAYARTALVHAHISRRRRRWTGESPFGLRPVHEPSAPDSDLDERDRVWAALRLLPDRQRAAVVLRYYADLPDREIAEALGCRPGTVASLVSRALANLREHGAFTEEGP